MVMENELYRGHTAEILFLSRKPEFGMFSLQSGALLHRVKLSR